MERLGRDRRFASLWLAAFAAAVSLTRVVSADETALDRYVAKPDASYAWRIARTVEGDGYTQYIVGLTSQTWRSEKDVDRPVWQHWLNIVKPAKPTSAIAFLRIIGGSNGGEPPRSAEQATIKLAEVTGTVVAELKMVPNQPLVFHQDGVRRKEDDFIAYTWNQFLQGGDEEWPARLPMVKSAARAMDCVQELLASEQGGKVRIEKFVVSGGSKRGWTTWCTAAVDKRVAAAIPIVIDVVNVQVCSRHHIAAYGFYARAIGDYVRHEIRKGSEDRLKLLYDIEDPYSYRERLTMPKFIVNAAGDQYFPPDSSQFYFPDLKGEKYLRYVPNADHSLRGSDAQESIIAFYQLVLNDKPRPKYTWTFEEDGSIRVVTEDAPKSVVLWHATNPNARDFRLMKIGKAYASQVLQDEGGGVFVGRVDAPAMGWTAYFVELTYDVGESYPLKLTTGVRIVPDTLPYADLQPADAPLEGRQSGN